MLWKHVCFYNSIEARRKYFQSLLENSPRNITENTENLIVLFIIKNVDSLNQLRNIKTLSVFLSSFSINLLVVYRESVNLIGYITRRLSADSLQL